MQLKQTNLIRVLKPVLGFSPEVQTLELGILRSDPSSRTCSFGKSLNVSKPWFKHL